MKKLTATLFAALAMAAVPVVVAPTANAVCGGVAGRNVAVGGCTHVVRDVAVGVALADDNDWAVQEANGQPPCYTPSGMPYYTPGDLPCY